MKQYKTKFLKSLAVFLLAFPILYIILAGTLFDIPLNSCVGILLSPFYYLVSFTALIAGYGLWEMRRWSWYLFVTSQILIGYENAVFVLGYSESHHKIVAYLISVSLQVMFVYWVGREIRVPYFFPKIRWWESNPRYRLSVPVSLDRKSGETLEGEILDLSVAGCFVKLRSDVSQDELLTLKFSIFDQDMICEGIGVWSAESAVTHPKGIGVKFNQVSRSQKRVFRSISRKLKKVSSLYRNYRYLVSQEEFQKKLEEIERSQPESG